MIAFLRVAGICLSHDKVKWAVGLVIGFGFAIARASCGFLYLKQQKHNKKRRKKEKKKLPYLHIFLVHSSSFLFTHHLSHSLIIFLVRSSFSSALPLAIEISAQQEIIMTVSSASSLSWWLLPRSITHPSLTFLSLGSLTSPPAAFLILSSFNHACIDVSPPFPALHDGPRFAFCTVGNPFSIVNARSLVSGYR